MIPQGKQESLWRELSACSRLYLKSSKEDRYPFLDGWIRQFLPDWEKFTHYKDILKNASSSQLNILEQPGRTKSPKQIYDKRKNS